MMLGLAIGFWLGVMWKQWIDALYETPPAPSREENERLRHQLVNGSRHV